MSAQQPLPFPGSSAPESEVFINARCLLRKEDEQRVVVVAGLPVHHYHAGDSVAEAYAMVFLVDSGYAQQKEVARAFGCSERTVRRNQRRYAERGMHGLETHSGWRRGRRRIPSSRARVIEALAAQGLSNRKIAQRLGLTENAIRKQVGPSKSEEQLKQMPLSGTSSSSQPPKPEIDDRALSKREAAPATTHTAENNSDLVERCDGRESDSEESEPVPMSLDRDPSDRTLDRLLACMGLLDDAAPMFRDGKQVPGAGVLLAIPVLVQSDIFRVSRKLYGEIGPAFYGLRTTLLTLLLMALLRIKRPEHLKERDPGALGRLLGLDRAPEVKTVRRKLTRLAAYHRAERLGAELARLRVAQRGQVMGFLYVDGHVRVYHGKRELPKGYDTRRRLAVPATTDYWVNDQRGDPVFVMTAPANAGLTKMLPNVLKEIRALVGERRVTIVFDRGGWSPKLFQKILKDNKFDILTYRKGKSRRIGEHRFVRRRAKLDSRWVTYRLHDQAVRFLKGKLRLRQVTRLCDNGHQTHVITSRWDLRDIEVAYRMFERWRQENFFKYMREEFLLDALADYHVEPDDPTRTVPNPERRALAKEIRAAKADVVKLEQEFGVAVLENPERTRRTVRGFKIAHSELAKKLRAARQHLARLQARRRKLATRVEVSDVAEGAVIKLATERKHLTNLIKMVAYQAESDLFALVQPHYARADQEGRTLLHEVFAAMGDIEVVAGELRITFAPLSSPHRTRAIQALCEPLNDTATKFPGTNLRLRFAMHPPPRIGLAFPETPPSKLPITAPATAPAGPP